MQLCIDGINCQMFQESNPPLNCPASISRLSGEWTFRIQNTLPWSTCQTISVVVVVVVALASDWPLYVRQLVQHRPDSRMPCRNGALPSSEMPTVCGIVYKLDRIIYKREYLMHFKIATRVSASMGHSGGDPARQHQKCDDLKLANQRQSFWNQPMAHVLSFLLCKN